ncbi:hypothetical protein PHLGIDRAFT_12627 [Phlebiopsis gigantea 11061_1 CR5-6]|uniref:DASH complex subunit DUO1 n=1 Tax=Phlebiopsis gigantea (strain 11061_1 CR5-6) TaxID=745531 RepID=A0A0C3PNL3_PHLG1|nr:hypothetical protein PHLGIDRAFT_12627 [Phlebiopsis gigantea 11061_1 CR5-6]
MQFTDNSSDFVVDESGSRLLSESLGNHSSSRSISTGHGGDDLSLSELSLTDPPPAQGLRRRPFSLLAQPRPSNTNNDTGDYSAVSEEPEDEGGLNETIMPEDEEKGRKMAERTREEKLQGDLFILKKLNSAFEVYKDALRETKSSTERVADQLVHTNALLDKYVNILSKSERVTRLILDERWQGAAADEEQVEREAREEMERLKREEEERVRAAQLEQEREEREEQERQAKLDRERIEREKAEVAKTANRGSGVRGVRGTRSSMRGARGASRAASTTATRSGISPSTSGSGGVPVRRTTTTARGAAASARPSGIARKT